MIDSVYRLSDQALLVHLRETINAATTRRAIAGSVRQLLAETLSEMIAERLVSTDLSPEQIVALSHVSPDAMPARVVPANRP